MNDHEYALKRVLALETALRAVMATVMETMSPPRIRNIDRIGCEWDRRLDALAVERGATDQAKG